jgi:hypothetical protein
VSTPLIDTTTGAQILAAIERLDGKMDGVLNWQAGHVEWRKHVDSVHDRTESRLDDLEAGDRARELSIVRVTAYAAGAGSIVSIIVSIGIAIVVKALTGH